MHRIIALCKKYVPQPVINYLWHFPKAALAAYMFGNPASGLQIITVTGTDGKTTTTTMLYHILKTARKKAALITSVEARIGRKSIETGLHVTSPDPFKLQALLRNMKSKKVRYICLEVTSHGLDQFRLFPIRSRVAVLTNITHEHLDYHGSFDNYVNAKLKLLKAAEHAVVNKDAEVFETIKAKLPNTPLATYSVDQESQLQAESVKLHKTKTTFKVGTTDYELPLTGIYNVYNALGAIGAALFLEISPGDIKRALKTFPGVKGRMEKVMNAKGRNIIIDFAHTPNALKEALTALNNMKQPDQKLIAVFGSAGLRDKTKRPIMGRVASELTDAVVLTAEDPRVESVDAIIEEIRAGISKGARASVHTIPDRQEAITYAITRLADTGDWIGIFGKGHEKSMNMDGREETRWSDHEAVENALRKL